MASLVLSNGVPASGKSTLARRFVDAHPLALNLDIDIVRGLLGRWLDKPEEAGLSARELALAMARTHLASGRHVVVPQLIARTGFIERLEQLADDVGAPFHETALRVGREDALRWFEERTAIPADQTHIDAAILAQRPGSDGGPDTLGAFHDNLAATLADRPRTKVVEVIRDDIDATFRNLERAIDPL